MDYRRDVEFGYFPAPNADDYPTIVEQTRIADETGLDLIGIQDHPYQRRFFDTFSLISDLAARTHRVRFFRDVANLLLRHPRSWPRRRRRSTGSAADGSSSASAREASGMRSRALGGPRRKPREAVDLATASAGCFSVERQVVVVREHRLFNGSSQNPP